MAEPESDEDFTRDDDDDVDSDYDVRDDDDGMQSSEVNKGRSMMKSSFGYGVDNTLLYCHLCSVSNCMYYF